MPWRQRRTRSAAVRRQSAAQSLANYTWTGLNGFSANTATAYIADAALDDAGTHLLEVTFTGLKPAAIG